MSIDAMKQVLAVMDTVAPSVEASAPRYYAAREALRAAIEQAQRNEFNPDWDAMAVMVEEQQRMAKRIEELEAQPEQEPVAWMYEWDGKKHLTFTDQRFVEEAHPHFNKSTPLYTTPPHRKPLSSEDIEQCCYEADSVANDHCQTWKWTEAFARAIEAKLKEKNT